MPKRLRMRFMNVRSVRWSDSTQSAKQVKNRLFRRAGGTRYTSPGTPMVAGKTAHRSAQNEPSRSKNGPCGSGTYRRRPHRARAKPAADGGEELGCPPFGRDDRRIERGDHLGMGRVIVHLLDAAEAAVARYVAQHVVRGLADPPCVEPERRRA